MKLTYHYYETTGDLHSHAFRAYPNTTLTNVRQLVNQQRKSGTLPGVSRWRGYIKVLLNDNVSLLFTPTNDD